ncbi:MAG: trehalose-6-phosphate synthase [Rhodospirillales bacterium]|nr:trehalose-6-phosphate synthase [Rhodospirillales bacterium]
MSRLVVLSNRLPQAGRTAQAGGLAVALADALRPGSLWFGWSGRISTDTSLQSHDERGVTHVTFNLSEAAYRGYYTGFSNNTLYPLLLFRLGLMRFRADEFMCYEAVNNEFASGVLPLLRDDDLIWIHDYHLMLVPAALRAAGKRQRIGFFFHTPFPPPEIFGVMPRARTLLNGVCGADVIGFQTASDRDGFLASATSMLGVRVDRENRFFYAGREVRTLVCPVGIDADDFARTARDASRRLPTERLRQSLHGAALLFGADRLDHAKGLPQRVDAYDLLLSRYPEHRRAVCFLQVAAPSREEVAEYRRLRRELDERVGDLNGRHGEADWIPLRYITRATPRTTIAGFYRLARVGVITPLRDGFGLGAAEFVAAQDPGDPGVLVLSRFAGAAATLDGAILVNPFDSEAIAEALHVALTMPADERLARHERLLDRVRAQSAADHARRFLDALAGVGAQVEELSSV